MAASLTSYRNVSACNRCRLRKNRCDQRLPTCSSCESANVACVGYDPITKREIPRSYVYFLEQRLENTEKRLREAGLLVPEVEIFMKEAESKPKNQFNLNDSGLDTKAANTGEGSAKEINDERSRTPRMNYFVLMVFAVGAEILDIQAQANDSAASKFLSRALTNFDALRSQTG